MKPRQPERRPVLLVAKAGAEPERTKQAGPRLRRADGQFPFKLFLVAGSRRGRSWAFRRDHRSPRAAGDQAGSGRRLDSQAKQASAAAEATVRRVIEGVLLEDAPGATRPKSAQPRNYRGHVPDAELDFDLAHSAAKRHGASIDLPEPTTGNSPIDERYCQTCRRTT